MANGQYCTPSGGIENDITLVNIGELHNLNPETFNITDTLQGTMHYYDRTTVDTATLHVGRTSQVIAESSYDYGDANIYRFSVYVDWNGDGDFGDPNEFVDSLTNNKPPFTVNVTPPANQPLGYYRMRLRYNSQGTDFTNACSDDEYYSETIDYTIEIATWSYPDTPEGTHNACNGIDFEDATHDAWGNYQGFHPEAHNFFPDPDGIGCCPDTCATDLGIDASPSDLTWSTVCGVFDAFTSRHTIVTPGIDAMTNTLQRVPPGGGNYAFRLGNANNGGEADRMETTFKVVTGQTDFSLSYAIVLNDPGHVQVQQPYFELGIYDADGRLIPGTRHFYSPDANTPGFVSSGGLLYRDWEQFFVDLTPYVNKDLTIRVTVADCAQGAHYAYAYLEFDCGDTSMDIEKELVKEESFLVYPNPNNGNFTVQSEIDENYNITVLDVTGKTVYSSNISNNRASFDLQHLGQGMYFVEVSATNFKKVEKIIIR